MKLLHLRYSNQGFLFKKKSTTPVQVNNFIHSLISFISFFSTKLMWPLWRHSIAELQIQTSKSPIACSTGKRHRNNLEDEPLKSAQSCPLSIFPSMSRSSTISLTRSNDSQDCKTVLPVSFWVLFQQYD